MPTVTFVEQKSHKRVGPSQHFRAALESGEKTNIGDLLY
jgi:hypothetical protein